MMLILALFGFSISMGLLCLGIMGALLTLVLRISTAILWVAVKILEHREPEILIVVGEERPTIMRDVTPRKQTARITQGD